MALRADDKLNIAMLRTKVTEFERASSIPMNASTALASRLPVGSGAGGAYAAGQSDGQALVVESTQSMAATAAKKAAKKAAKAAKNKARLKNTECWAYVRGTCKADDSCARRHGGAAARDPNYKLDTPATAAYQSRNADNRGQPPGGSYYAGHFNMRQPAWYDRLQGSPAFGMHQGFQHSGAWMMTDNGPIDLSVTASTAPLMAKGQSSALVFDSATLASLSASLDLPSAALASPSAALASLSWTAFASPSAALASPSAAISVAVSDGVWSSAGHIGQLAMGCHSVL